MYTEVWKCQAFGDHIPWRACLRTILNFAPFLVPTTTRIHSCPLDHHTRCRGAIKESQVLTTSPLVVVVGLVVMAMATRKMPALMIPPMENRASEVAVLPEVCTRLYTYKTDTNLNS